MATRSPPWASLFSPDFWNVRCNKEFFMAATTASLEAQSLLERFDSARLSRFHLRIILVAGFNWIWAAFGVTIIGFLIPDMRQEWSLSSSQVGLVASVTLLGMMFGSVIA